MTRAFVFPGQGSQAVGMGSDLAQAFPAAREVFEEIDECLSQHLSKLMFEGPDDALRLTENAQPALLGVSMAVVRVLAAEGGLPITGDGEACAFVAGHSLGEYSALAAAGSLSLTDAARLLKRRGQAMQEAVPVGEGAMAALLGLDVERALRVAEQARTDPETGAAEICDVANDNGGGQVVVSGAAGAVRRAIDLAKEHGAKRAVELPVSAPFHSALMEPAAEVMAAALEKVEIARPAVPVVANVTAEPVEQPDRIRELLVDQICAMVRWRESVLQLRALGVEGLVECGSGKVLSGLVRRIDPELTAVSLQTPDDIEAFLKAA
ncbi:MAG: ACP S-malonyltransferase [Alphaproteobacteria bacterium]|nr:ACP S-malonyltransferase [Alphaproteobacteria bacterium]